MSQVEIKEEKKPFRFTCLNCNVEFDQAAHAPFVLSKGYHTICKACLNDSHSKDPEGQEKPNTLKQQQFTLSQAVEFPHFEQLKQQLIKSTQISPSNPAGTESSGEVKLSTEEELQKQRQKVKWLIGYCGELGSRYQDMLGRQRKIDEELRKKIGKYQDSLEKLSKEFWRVRGDHEFQQENFEKIIEFSQHIITNSPNFDYQSHGFGSSEDQIGLFEMDPVKWYCRGRLDQSFNSSPYDILSLAYLITGNHLDAEQWYSAKIAKNHNSYQLLLSLANTQYNLGKYSEAQKLYQRVIELKPELDKPYQQLAFIKGIKQNQPQEGRKWAKLALQKNAGNIYASYLLAVTEELLEDRISKLVRLTEQNKSYARAYNGLGLLYKQKKDDEEALKCYKKAIEINPKYDAPYYGIGIIYYNRGQFDEAIRWFEQSNRVNPQYENALYGLGSTYHKKDNNQEAIKWYEKCLQLNPKHVKAHNGLGTIYALLEKYDAASQHFRTCMELDQKHYLSHNALGNVYFCQGKYEEAKDQYLKCIEINPGYGGAYNGLSNVYLKKGQQEEARRWYERKVQAVK